MDGLTENNIQKHSKSIFPSFPCSGCGYMTRFSPRKVGQIFICLFSPWFLYNTRLFSSMVCLSYHQLNALEWQEPRFLSHCMEKMSHPPPPQILLELLHNLGNKQTTTPQNKTKENKNKLLLCEPLHTAISPILTNLVSQLGFEP